MKSGDICIYYPNTNQSKFGYIGDHNREDLPLTGKKIIISEVSSDGVWCRGTFIDDISTYKQRYTFHISCLKRSKQVTNLPDLDS